MNFQASICLFGVPMLGLYQCTCFKVTGQKISIVVTCFNTCISTGYAPWNWGMHTSRLPSMATTSALPPRRQMFFAYHSCQLPTMMTIPMRNRWCLRHFFCLVNSVFRTKIPGRVARVAQHSPKSLEELSRWESLIAHTGSLVVPPRVAFGFAWHCTALSVSRNDLRLICTILAAVLSCLNYTMS